MVIEFGLKARRRWPSPTRRRSSDRSTAVAPFGWLRRPASALACRPVRMVMVTSAPGTSCFWSTVDRPPRRRDGAEHETGLPAQQLLGAVLQAAAADQVAGPIPSGRQRPEIVGGHLADVADGLAGQPLLRVDPRAVLARLAKTAPRTDTIRPRFGDAALASASRQRRAREQQRRAPADLPAIGTGVERQLRSMRTSPKQSVVGQGRNGTASRGTGGPPGTGVGVGAVAHWRIGRAPVARGGGRGGQVRRSRLCRQRSRVGRPLLPRRPRHPRERRESLQGRECFAGSPSRSAARGAPTWPRSRPRPARQEAPRQWRAASSSGGRARASDRASAGRDGPQAPSRKASATSAMNARALRRWRPPSSGEHHAAEALGGLVTGALTELLGAAPQPLRGLGEVAELARWSSARRSCARACRRCRRSGSPRWWTTGTAPPPSTARGRRSRCCRKFSGSRAVGKTASTVTCPTARWSG